MQGDGPIGCDQHIAAALIDVPLRLPQRRPSRQPFEVRPPSPRSPYIPSGSTQHSIVVVRSPGSIDQDRPRQRSVFSVAAREKIVFEGHDRGLHSSFSKFLFMITQLRDVGPARQSAEVAVKYQQEPLSCVILKGVLDASRIRKLKRNCRLARQVAHASRAWLHVTQMGGATISHAIYRLAWPSAPGIGSPASSGREGSFDQPIQELS